MCKIKREKNSQENAFAFPSSQVIDDDCNSSSDCSSSWSKRSNTTKATTALTNTMGGNNRAKEQREDVCKSSNWQLCMGSARGKNIICSLQVASEDDVGRNRWINRSSTLNKRLKDTVVMCLKNSENVWCVAPLNMEIFTRLSGVDVIHKKYKKRQQVETPHMRNSYGRSESAQRYCERERIHFGNFVICISPHRQYNRAVRDKCDCHSADESSGRIDRGNQIYLRFFWLRAARREWASRRLTS